MGVVNEEGPTKDNTTCMTWGGGGGGGGGARINNTYSRCDFADTSKVHPIHGHLTLEMGIVVLCLEKCCLCGGGVRVWWVGVRV